MDRPPAKKEEGRLDAVPSWPGFKGAKKVDSEDDWLPRDWRLCMKRSGANGTWRVFCPPDIDGFYYTPFRE